MNETINKLLEVANHLSKREAEEPTVMSDYDAMLLVIDVIGEIRKEETCQDIVKQ